MDAHIDIELPAGVAALARALTAEGYDALLVGGAVRDALLGRSTADFDLVTDATPTEVRTLANCCGGVSAIYPLGERFGTLGMALNSGGILEVTRYREAALDAPDAEARFAIDAGVRDFTLNAVGLRLPDGTVLDPVGGRADLEAGLLRAPGDADSRFAEDPIRVLRACRFVAELGFEIEPVTRAAMPLHIDRLAGVAVERIREELGKLLVGRAVGGGLRIALETGVLGEVLPEVAALDGVTQPSFHDLDVFGHTLQAVENTPPDRVLRWAALLHDVGKPPTRTVEDDGRIRFFTHAKAGAEIAESICRRLKMSNAETAKIVHLVRTHMRLGEVNVANPRSVDRAVRKLDLWAGSERLVSAEDALELTIADFGATAHRAEASAVRKQLDEAVRDSRQRGTRRPPVSPISGGELIDELGLAEGPRVGSIKRAIEAAIARGEIEPSDRAGAMAVARKALQDGEQGPVEGA